ncbi:MAG: hypothetical protein CMB80_28565 [Flammeovirgaceae bacterium]|nr:hypothetical protein [Flammeovirgaceae bacterium]|tara:strand:- start:382 stop:609 length:228 start_codon:yes stop_codon:yes gene_type:complete
MDKKITAHRRSYGIEIITKTLKRFNYELIHKIGIRKQLSKYEIGDLIDEFWKVSYYTPEIVKQTYAEDCQKFLLL